jgi:hypothetical protein
MYNICRALIDQDVVAVPVAQAYDITCKVQGAPGCTFAATHAAAAHRSRALQHASNLSGIRTCEQWS